MSPTGGGESVVGPARGGPLGELVKRCRTSAWLSQAELAERCGLSERAIRNIESGATTRPRRFTVQAIGTALGLTGDDLTRFMLAGRQGSRAPAAVAVPARPAPASASPADRDTAPEPVARREPVTVSVDGVGVRGVELVGRDTELRTLATVVMAGQQRLITITGLSGVGKSRLAAELVAALQLRTGVDAYRLDLSATVDPELVGELVAEVLGAGGASRLSPLERVAAHLRTARVLLVVDSMERVVAAAGWIRRLVQRCTGLTVLATSQIRLGVDGEHEIRLAPLAVPGQDTDMAALAALPSVRLLVRRAQLVRPEFALTAANAVAVAAVCRGVDGLPLAIELAAARLRMVTPAELAQRLDRQLEMLAGGLRGIPDRHRSLRAAIESSLEIVDEPARELFVWLGAFAGGARLADLESTAGAHDSGWPMEALAELVDASLVRITTADDTSHYRLPDAIAELARGRLADRLDAREIRRTVSVHFLKLVRGVERGSGSRPGRSLLGHDDNVRAALGWITANDVVLIDRLAIDAIYRCYDSAGRYAEGQVVLAAIGDALVAAGRQATGGYAWIRAGRTATLRYDLPAAARFVTMGLAVLDDADHEGHAMGYLLRAVVDTYDHDLAAARRQIELALRHGRQHDDDLLLGRILNNLGNLAMQLGELPEARRQLTEALQARRRAGAGPVDIACTLNNLAEVALELADYQMCAEHATEAVRLARAAGHDRLAADTLSIHGLALVALGRTAEAVTLTAPAGALLDVSEEHHNVVSVAVLRRSVVLHAAGDARAAAPVLAAAVPTAKGNIERVDLTLTLEWHAALLAVCSPVTSALLLGAAGRYRRSLNRPVASVDARRIDRTAAQCRATLGSDHFDRELAHGAALDQAALVRLCAGIGDPDGSARPPGGAR